MSENRCPVCGEGKLETRREVRKYAGGVDVTLVNVPVRRCPKCGEEFVVIGAVEQLHRLIAEDLARSPRKLGPAEIRFLRTHLGYSSADFARAMGVTAETVSRWESKRAPQQMAPTAERLLRLMALQDKPIESYGLGKVSTGRKHSAPTLRLRPTAVGWAAA